MFCQPASMRLFWVTHQVYVNTGAIFQLTVLKYFSFIMSNFKKFTAGLYNKIIVKKLLLGKIPRFWHLRSSVYDGKLRFGSLFWLNVDFHICLFCITQNLAHLYIFKALLLQCKVKKEEFTMPLRRLDIFLCVFLCCCLFCYFFLFWDTLIELLSQFRGMFIFFSYSFVEVLHKFSLFLFYYSVCNFFSTLLLVSFDTLKF